MQIRQLTFQQHMVMVGTRNIARSACTGTTMVQRFMHRRNHFGILTLPQIIVGTPHRNGRFLPAFAEHRFGIGTGFPLKIGENPVIASLLHFRQVVGKELFVVH